MFRDARLNELISVVLRGNKRWEWMTITLARGAPCVVTVLDAGRIRLPRAKV